MKSIYILRIHVILRRCNTLEHVKLPVQILSLKLLDPESKLLYIPVLLF